jgi:hypothetical protein
MDWATYSPTSAKILLIDGRASNDALSYAERQGIRLILSTDSRRAAPKDWAETKLSLDHAAVGGVTAKTQRILVYHRDCLNLNNLDIETAVPRDASTILFEKTHASKHRKAPSDARIVPLNVHVHCTDSKGRNVYHGGGLLPNDLNTRTQVITPYLFAKRGSWGLRGLSKQELCIALDCPKDLAKSLALTMDSNLLQNLKPGKCLREALRGVLKARKIVNSRHFPVFETQGNSKRLAEAKIDRVSLAENKSKRIKLGQDLVDKGSESVTETIA